MCSKLRVIPIVVMLLLSLAFVPTSEAALSPTVGAVDPANGFPGWYMDLGVPLVRGPLALAQCLDLSGFCLVLGVNPGPIVFPGNFPDEWFYFIAETGPFGTANVFYRTALEAAFAGPLGAVVAGDQSVFTRRRVRADSVAGGTYTATDFYGIISIPGVPAATIRGVNFTEDFGIGVAGNFVLATTGPVGPFVTSTTGFVTDPVSGNIYLANPNVAVTVTGGPVSNIFTLTGPDGTFTSSAFTIAGKLTSMQVTPTVMKFPPVNPQRLNVDSAPQTVTILALADLTIPALVTSGPNSADFRIQGSLAGDPVTNTCPVAPAILAATTTCTFNVIFNSAVAVPADKAASIVIAPTTASAAPATVVMTGQIDAIAPTIVTHFPNVQQAPNNVTMTAVFSEPMLASSITPTTFTVTANGVDVPGTLAFNEASKTLTFDPTTDPTIGALVTVTTTTFITDIAGNSVVPITNFGFTAIAPDITKPKILSMSPANQATGVRTDAPFTVQFDEPMREDTITNSTFVVTASGGAAVPGSVTYNATNNTATFTPASPLAFGSPYTVTITAGVADIAANTLAASNIVTFLTNYKPAAAVLQVPANGATGVARPVVLRWNPATDQDAGDTLTYHLFLCNNPAFVGSGANCRVNEPITPTLAKANGVYYASVASGSMLFSLFGLGWAFGFKGRKKILLILVVLVMSGLFIASCSSDSEDSPPAPTQLTFQVDGLSGGVAYYWRIEANDSNGGISATETQVFTTTP